jgi:hypothetical protein
MSVQDKLDALSKTKSYHDENSDKIRFDPNVPKTVVFPSNWDEYLSNIDKEFDDKDNPGQKKTVTYTVYKVYNPNSANAKKLRTIEASAALDAQIGKFLGMALEQGYSGACIAKIEKIQKGSSQNITWSVQGDRFDETKLDQTEVPKQ